VVVNAFYHRDYQQREPIEIRIYPSSIVFLNHGGPDRSIKMEAFMQGQVRSRRYRNRRLGEFLKELDLTEGRATGIPTIIKELRENGSPEPKFITDNDYTCFEVELFIHPEFEIKLPFVPKENVLATLDSIDAVLDQLLNHYGLNSAAVTDSAIAGFLVGVQAYELESIENQVKEAIANVDNAIVGAIASAIAENERKILVKALVPSDRELLLTHIGVTNHRKNYENYMLPMVSKGWLSMTIPNKPTSPKQKYLTTLKGKLILEFLKKSGIGNKVSGKNKKG
jgi:ATP-dependent DNA helicase RecG